MMKYYEKYLEVCDDLIKVYLDIFIDAFNDRICFDENYKFKKIK